MKKNNKTISIALGVAAIALLAYGTYRLSRPQIGIINFVKVQQTAKVYTAAAEQQKKYDEQIQEIIMKDKDFVQLQADGNKLADQQKTMDKDEFERKSNALQAKALKIQERYRASFERNAMASQLALKAVEKQIAEAIEATSQKTGAQVLLPVNTILYASDKADFTEIFVKELDKRVQTVNYPDPVTLK